MANSSESQRYYRVKEYPQILGRIGRVGLMTAGGLLFAHAAPDLIHTYIPHAIPVVEGLSQLTNDGLTALSNGTAWVGEHLPFVGQYARRAPDFVLNNPVTDQVLSHVPQIKPYLHESDLVTTEVAAAAGGIAGVGESALIAVRSPRTAPEPTPAQQQEAQRVVQRLQQRHHAPSSLNEQQVAVEIAGEAEDLRKGEVDRSAIFARALGPVAAPLLNKLISYVPFLRKTITPEWAARTTLRKEIYHRMRGGPDHRLWGVLDSVPANYLKRFPGPGDGLNWISDIGDYILGIFHPKRDIYGKWHFGIDDVLVDTVSTLLGDNLPVVNSSDFQEFVEVMARPVLVGGMNGEVDNAAAIIVGSKVKHAARRYTSEPKKVL